MTKKGQKQFPWAPIEEDLANALRSSNQTDEWWATQLSAKYHCDVTRKHIEMFKRRHDIHGKVHLRRIDSEGKRKRKEQEWHEKHGETPSSAHS